MAARSGFGGALETIIGVRGIKISKYLRLRAKMIAGHEPFTSLNMLDRQLLQYLPQAGYFVEAGANDGVDQSNTFYLEKKLGWGGLLIEPFEPLSRLSSRFRSAKVIAAALGAPEDEGKQLQLTFSDLMTSSFYERSRTPRWGGILGPNPTSFSAPVRTLTSILDEVSAPQVTLLSLDVEGLELQVLRGLDLGRHRPTFILVETAHPDAVQAALGQSYTLEHQLSHHDYLFRDMQDHGLPDEGVRRASRPSENQSIFP